MAGEKYSEDNSSQEDQAKNMDVGDQSEAVESDKKDQSNSKGNASKVMNWKSREISSDQTNLGSLWLFWLAWSVMTVFAFWQQQWLFFVVVVSVGLFWLLLRNPNSEELEVRLSEGEITTGNRTWQLSNFGSFWIEDKISPPRLHLNHQNPVIPDLVFTIEDVDAEQLRELLEAIPERKQPNWTDRASKWFGFD